MRRRAKLLEDKLNNPEAAASALRELGTDAIADDEMLAALLRNLRRAGLAHEASRALSQRIEIERTRGGADSGKRVAELNLELSLLKLDDLHDPAAARKEVESALEAAPENPAALAALAQLHLKQNDFAAYAATRVREARALRGRPDAIDALLDAGRVYREQVQSPDEGAGLLRGGAGGGARTTARRCARWRRCSPPRRTGTRRAACWNASWRRPRTRRERAAVYTDLARTAWEGFSDGAEAHRYLDEALALVPNHLPAILAVADIHYKEGQWEQAEKRLTEAVRRLRGQPQQAAKLFQRLAEVHEKLGKLDEAYRQLVEADRMGPGQLLTKLSLGENRFRAGRWREAAMHLGSLADHPDAALYPEEVADALAHAAQAEIKLRHPERAIELYEAALKLRGNHRPTLRALAELALERGEKEKAANYPAPHRRGLERPHGARADVRAARRSVPRAGRRGAGAGGLRRGGQGLQRAGRGAGLAAREGAEAAAVHRRERGRGADLGAARRAGQGSEGARRAAPRGRADARRARRRAAAQPSCWSRRWSRIRRTRRRWSRCASSATSCPRASGCRRSWDARWPGCPRRRPTTAARAAGARSCGSGTASWPARRRPGHRHRGVRAGRRRSTPEQLEAREALGGPLQRRPGYEDAAIENHRRLLALDVTRADSLRALAAAYTRRGPARSRALLPRGAVGAGPRDHGRGGVPARHTRPTT